MVHTRLVPKSRMLQCCCGHRVNSTRRSTIPTSRHGGKICLHGSAEPGLPFHGMRTPNERALYTISVVSCVSLANSRCPQCDCLLYSLKKARLDPLFDNVLRRKEHCHARCTQCDMFSSRFAQGFLSTEELEEWEAKRNVHRKR
jgi:hypothetical protein